MSSPVNNQTPVRPVGDLILAKREINATSKLGKFIFKGETDNKTISENKAIRIVLRLLAGASLLSVVVPALALAIDGADTLRCKVLNNKTNATIEKVETVVNRLINTNDTFSDKRKTLLEQELPAAVREFQAIALKRANGMTGGSFQRQLDVFADGKALLAKKINSVAHNDNIAKTFVTECFKTLVNASANEVAANFPLVDETMATEQAKKLAAFTGRPESEVLMDIRFQIKENKTAKSIDESKAALVKLNSEYNTQGHDHADIVARQTTLKTEHDTLAGTIDGEMESTRKTAEDNLKKTNDSIVAILNLNSAYFTADVTGNLGTNTELAMNNFGAKIAGLSDAQKKELNDSFTKLVTLYGDRAKFQKELDAAVKAKLDAGTKCHEMARRFKRDWTIADANGHLYDANLLKSEMVNDNNEKIAKLDRVLTAVSSEAYKAANKPEVNKNIVQAKIEQLNDVIRLLNSPAAPAAKIDGARLVINTLGLQGKVYGAVYEKYSSTMTTAERSHPQAGENACFTLTEQANNLSRVQVELQAIIVELENSIVK